MADVAAQAMRDTDEMAQARRVQGGGLGDSNLAIGMPLLSAAEKYERWMGTQRAAAALGGDLRVSTAALRRRRVPLGTLAQMVKKRVDAAQKARAAGNIACLAVVSRHFKRRQALLGGSPPRA